MHIEIINQGPLKLVGIRITDYMTNLDGDIALAHQALIKRMHEIQGAKNPNISYGVSPPNYKGNDGLLDFYVCVEADPFQNLPHGMSHLTIEPAMYACTTYQGPTRKKEKAYEYTTKWINENGYEYNDVHYYFEIYGEKTNMSDLNDEENEINIYSPVRKI